MVWEAGFGWERLFEGAKGMEKGPGCDWHGRCFVKGMWRTSHPVEAMKVLPAAPAILAGAQGPSYSCQKASFG